MTHPLCCWFTDRMLPTQPSAQHMSVFNWWHTHFVVGLLTVCSLPNHQHNICLCLTDDTPTLLWFTDRMFPTQPSAQHMSVFNWWHTHFVVGLLTVCCLPNHQHNICLCLTDDTPTLLWFTDRMFPTQPSAQHMSVLTDDTPTLLRFTDRMFPTQPSAQHMSVFNWWHTHFVVGLLTVCSLPNHQHNICLCLTDDTPTLLLDYWPYVPYPTISTTYVCV